MQRQSTGIRLCLFGAAPDTSNLGVSALFLSVLNAIAARFPDAQVTVFDHGRGPREDEVHLQAGRFRFTRIGANLSRRYYRRDSLFNMRLSAALGGMGNPGVRAIDAAHAVFDLSGGDSFADLYGDKRFRAMTQSKRLVLGRRTPLILLPQTYGPFEHSRAREIARGIVRGVSMAWARDARSFETLKELLGDDFDPTRHAAGIDVAFALPRRRPDDLPARLAAWIQADRAHPVIGFNISGLIYNQGAEGSRQFGFVDDYSDIIDRSLRRFLEASDANVVLIPHVLARDGHYESDPQACRDAAAALGAEDRVMVLDRRYNSMEMKWVIAQLDFFCGTRMHSTIAGLSSGVPTGAIAYSKKTLGVFETCGQGDCVTDPRHADAESCVRDIWRVWERRSAVSASLAEHLPAVRHQAKDQSDRIFNHIENLRSVVGQDEEAAK